MKTYMVSVIVSAFCLALPVVNAGKAIPANKNQIKGKILTCPEMPMLDTMLTANPIGTLRMNLAYNSAKKTLAELHTLQDTPQEITAKMTILLAPVEEFFSIIQSFSSVIKPLVEESLLEKDATGNYVYPRNKRVYLLDFFKTTGGASAFFKSNVTTKKALEDVCEEFRTFFANLNASLSEESKKSYKILVTQYKNRESKEHKETD